jgi:uncharacterized membrane protein YbhN (UPF0104 family)
MRVLRFAVTAALLLALVWWLDVETLAARFAQLRVSWALLALAISVPQMALLAYRWQLTARRLGLDMTLGRALREYYLGCFINQILPGGWLGDASRAGRQARAGSRGRAGPEAKMGPSVRAVILERASGQIFMTAVAVISLLTLPITFGTSRPAALLLGAIGLVGALLVWAMVSGHLPGGSALATLGRDARTALFERDVVATQLVTSALVTSSYIGMYVVSARAVGVETPLATLVPLVAPVLFSMLIPVTVAGWGVREATAAGLWSAVGLTPEDGVAISAAYGLVVLVSTLPGAVVLLTSRRAG